MQIVIPTPYDRPDDGYAWCESCQYLEPIHTEYVLDDRIVPLCRECSDDLTN